MEEDLWAQREEAERLHGEVKKKEFSGERRREEGKRGRSGCGGDGHYLGNFPDFKSSVRPLVR